jgi:hypothetical protein
VARIALYEILAFLLPFALYFVWRLLVTRGSRLLEDTPWFVLTVAGLVMVCASFVLFVLLEPGAPPGATYVPPHLEGGRLVPGGFRSP